MRSFLPLSSIPNSDLLGHPSVPAHINSILPFVFLYLLFPLCLQWCPLNVVLAAAVAALPGDPSGMQCKGIWICLVQQQHSADMVLPWHHHAQKTKVFIYYSDTGQAVGAGKSNFQDRAFPFPVQR